MDLNRISRQRERLMALLSEHARRRHDGTLLINEYIKLTNILLSNGRRVGSRQPYLTKEYWDNPANKDREYTNKNPIISVSEESIVWKNWQYQQFKPKEEKHVESQPQAQPIVNSSNYYILNVVGLDKYVDSVEVFIRDLGCKRIEHSYTSIEWQYEGTEKEFNIIRRSVTGLIDTLIPHNMISVYGKKISQKIV